MPYSEFHQMAKGKLESTQAKLSNCSTDLAFVPDKELVELVWKNDQISMQGQFDKTQKIPSCTGFSKDQENDAGDTVTTKILKFGTSDSILNNFSLSGPLGHMGLGQEDEVAHWLSYPLDDYSSEFFSELSGVNLNVHLEQNNAAPSDKNCTNGRIVLDSHSVPIYGGATPELQNAFKVFGEGHEPSNSLSRSSQLCSSPMQQRQTSLPLHRSSVSDSTTRNVPSTHQAPCVNSTRNLASTSRPPNTSMQKQNTAPSRPPLLPSHNTGFVNFSHFLRRPSTLSKTNLQSIDTAASPASSSIDRLRSYDKLSVVGSTNPIESMVIELPSGSTSITGFQRQTDSMPGMVDVRPSMGKPPKEPLFAKQSVPLCQEDAFWKTSGFAESVDIERPDSGKTAEPLVASSSACSDTSAGGASNDPKHVLKRKSRDTEESEYPSEDVEEESVARKSATARGSTGTKRSRAAEVHNLSERRRRDRINEKMRALQELIPNCNKVDKASMLDEAIEYLKNLQLQVQIMSMGTGLFVPPMMLPTGMQPMRAPHMAHFSTMGIGMGTGMGRVTGMLNMSGGSSGCPLIQVPPMHRPQVPCPPLSGPSKTGSSIQMFGFSGQGLPMPMPHASFIPFSGGPFTKLISLPVVSGAATPLEVPSSQLIPIIAECSQNQTSTQAKREREEGQRPVDQGCERGYDHT